MRESGPGGWGGPRPQGHPHQDRETKTHGGNEGDNQPENFQEKSVDRLRKAVVAIQQATAIDATLEELYQSVENLCSHGMAERVYQALKLLVETYVQDCVQQFLGESLDKLIFMKKMNDCWSGHCRQMIMIRSIFLFLDRTYVLQHPSVMSIWELGLDTFRRCILTNQLGNTS